MCIYMQSDLRKLIVCMMLVCVSTTLVGKVVYMFMSQVTIVI